MVLEEYCSFETAKLLKEKGFDASLKMYWSMGTSDIPILYCCPQHPVDDGEEPMPIEIDNSGKECTNRSNPWKPKEFECIAPTQQMACRWLREVHHLLIVTDCWFGKPEYFNWYSKVYVCDHSNLNNDVELPRADTYEESVELAIKYCLEHLID